MPRSHRSLRVLLKTDAVFELQARLDLSQNEVGPANKSLVGISSLVCGSIRHILNQLAGDGDQASDTNSHQRA